ARLSSKGAPAISPSDLEKLAGCPFRFFTERLCRFDVCGEPGEEISPKDAGDLWHAVLADFYREELKQAEAKGRLTARLDPAARNGYLERLLFLAGQQLAYAASQHFTGHPGFWTLQEER